MKTCTLCKLQTPLDEFHRRAARPSGVTSRCKACKALLAADYSARNLDAVRARSLAWHHANSERSIANTRRWQAENADRYKAKAAEWWAANQARRAQMFRDWAAANPGAVRALKAKRRAAQKKASAAWASAKAIRAIYRQAAELSAATGVEHVVDHIVPLQSPLVCGLHVENNLRPIPKRDNESKGNRWWPDMAEAA